MKEAVERVCACSIPALSMILTLRRTRRIVLYLASYRSLLNFSRSKVPYIFGIPAKRRPVIRLSLIKLQTNLCPLIPLTRRKHQYSTQAAAMRLLMWYHISFTKTVLLLATTMGLQILKIRLRSKLYKQSTRRSKVKDACSDRPVLEEVYIGGILKACEQLTLGQTCR